MEEVITAQESYPEVSPVHTEYQEEQLEMLKLKRKALEAAYNNLNEVDSWEEFNRKEYIDSMLRIAQTAY